MKLIQHINKIICLLSIITMGLGNTSGCMDDGYQQWSPNPGSPACNYDPFAIVEGECSYCDCSDSNCGLNDSACGGSASLDCEGICGGGAIEDECGVCNGTGTQKCCGGTTLVCDISDCINIYIDPVDSIFSGISNFPISVFATDTFTINSLDIEFDYDSSIVGITNFSIVGTDLNDHEYTIAYYDIPSDDIQLNQRTKFTMYYNPTYTVDNQFGGHCDQDTKNIFTLKLSTLSSADDTQIKIHKLVLNENQIDINDWNVWETRVYLADGCTDSEACNYDEFAMVDNGSCKYEEDCSGECGGDATNDICGVCSGGNTGLVYIDNINDCECLNGINLDCNGDCPPSLGCPSEFSLAAGCAKPDECNVCVGGATGRVPCEADCSNSIETCNGTWDVEYQKCWGGNAYEDGCGVCVGGLTGENDCFSAKFKIYNTIYDEIEDFTVKASEHFYVALYMKDFPSLLEGMIIHLDYEASVLEFNSSSLSFESSELDTIITGVLENLYDLEYTYTYDTTYIASIYNTANEFYQGHDGNILFLEFDPLGSVGDSTVLNYSKVQVNEHFMKDANYTSQVVYFSDCNGDKNGNAVQDNCGTCDNDSSNDCVQDCNGDFGGTGIIDECGDCVGGTTGLEVCILSTVNLSLLPERLHLGQNYPNPFNPNTYIQYNVPHYDYITIKIINLRGQIINSIVQKSHQPGSYEIMWDGTNHYGTLVPTGIYFYRMDATNFTSIKKLVILK